MCCVPVRRGVLRRCNRPSREFYPPRLGQKPQPHPKSELPPEPHRLILEKPSWTASARSTLTVRRPAAAMPRPSTWTGCPIACRCRMLAFGSVARSAVAVPFRRARTGRSCEPLAWGAMPDERLPIQHHQELDRRDLPVRPIRTRWGRPSHPRAGRRPVRRDRLGRLRSAVALANIADAVPRLVLGPEDRIMCP
jgi:hypothetical protein